MCGQLAAPSPGTEPSKSTWSATPLTRSTLSPPRLRRQPQSDGGPRSGGRLELERAAGVLGAAAHQPEAHVAVLAELRVRGESAAIVVHPQLEPTVLAL